MGMINVDLPINGIYVAFCQQLNASSHSRTMILNCYCYISIYINVMKSFMRIMLENRCNFSSLGGVVYA